jgi:error-prone DNA polymerase
MLTAIRKAFDLIAGFQAPSSARPHRWGHPWTLATIPAEDPAVYDMICRADTVGVFQIESRAQMSMLPRLKPRCFYDLIIEISIVRPGPIQGGMVHPYLKRRAGKEAVTYPNDAIREVLQKTLGVPLFQEQVMRLAMVAAGFTPGEADQVRRAMGAWRRPGVIAQLREKMLAGMLRNGLPPKYAELIFEQIRGFGEYGFPESHAASFALLVYASAWLKRYHQAAFTCSLLNSQPMGFYAPAQLVRDAQRHGVTVLPADVNQSAWDCALETPRKLRLGLRMVRGLSNEKHAAPIVRARAAGPFRSVAELARRTGLNKAVLSRLAAADALQSLGLERRAALWEVLAIQEELPLFEGLDAEERAPALPATPLEEHVAQDYETTGLSLKAHPLSLLRAELDAAGLRTCAQLQTLKDGAWVRTGGLVLMRQRPGTASGVVFMTIEDETGQANLIIWPSVFERCRKAGRSSSAVLVEGRWQRQGKVCHIVVQRLRDLSESLPDLRWRSRDFR